MKSVEQTPNRRILKDIPLVIRESVKRVPVEEYLKLRLTDDARRVSYSEQGEINRGVDEMIRQAEIAKKTYNPEARLSLSVDPLVIVARKTLVTLPFSWYFDAREKVLNAAIDQLKRKRQNFESHMGYEKELDIIDRKLSGLESDLKLTTNIYAAARPRH